MAISKQKGDTAEAYVLFFLKSNGFNVLFPWGEDNRYDLVSEKNGIFKRIQVKYVTPRHGVLEVAFRSSNNFNIIHYSYRDVDIIAAFCGLNRKVYLIPLKQFKNRSCLKLRVLPARNSQRKFVIPAEKFESRIDFLLK